MKTPPPATIWFTGLTASGKTSLAKHLHEFLQQEGVSNAVLLDGDELRKQYDRSYGHSPEERDDVLRNIVRIAKEKMDDGKIAIVAAVSHSHSGKKHARDTLGNFMEVYLDCPPEVCAGRDYKGHYKRAYAGELDCFIGVTHEYEPSENPELVLKTGSSSFDECKTKLERAALDFLNKGSK